MKFASAFAAAVMGACLFAGGASAAPMSAPGALPDMAAATTLESVACRSVQKRVCVSGKGCRVTTRRTCSGPERPWRRACRSERSRSCTFRHGRRVCEVRTRRVCR